MATNFAVYSPLQREMGTVLLTRSHDKKVIDIYKGQLGPAAVHHGVLLKALRR